MSTVCMATTIIFEDCFYFVGMKLIRVSQVASGILFHSSMTSDFTVELVDAKDPKISSCSVSGCLQSSHSLNNPKAKKKFFFSNILNECESNNIKLIHLPPFTSKLF